MTTTNAYGIFANSINGTVNTGLNAVRHWSREKCARVWRAAAATLPAEEIAYIRETHKPDQDMALCGVTAAQSWASRILSSAQAHHSISHLVVGSETSQQIHDARPADAILRQMMAA